MDIYKREAVHGLLHFEGSHWSTNVTLGIVYQVCLMKQNGLHLIMDRHAYLTKTSHKCEANNDFVTGHTFFFHHPGLLPVLGPLERYMTRPCLLALGQVLIWVERRYHFFNSLCLLLT